MASITLQNLLEQAQGYQKSHESNPDALADILQTFADQMNSLAETAPANIRVKLETQRERILQTKAGILFHRVGQLSFWGQMVEVEDIAKTCLGPVRSKENKSDELSLHLMSFHNKLCRVHHLPCELPALDGQTAKGGNKLPAIWIGIIEILFQQIPEDENPELMKKWAEFKNLYLLFPDKGLKALQEMIDLLPTVEAAKDSDSESEKVPVETQLAFLEGAISSQDTGNLMELLLTLPIYELTGPDKVTVLQKAIDQPTMASLETLLAHDCFNEVSLESYEKAIAYAQEQRKEGYALLLQSTDGYVKVKFGK